MTRVVVVVALLVAPLAGCRVSETSLSSNSEREPVEVTAAIDRPSATTGDLVTFTVEVDHDADYEVEIDDAEMNIAGLPLVDFGIGAPRRRRGRIVESRWYRLRADLVGVYELPSLSVHYRLARGNNGGDADGSDWPELETVSSVSIPFAVESVLPPDGEAREIRDIKPLQELPVERPWLPWAIGAASVLLLALAWLLWARRRRDLAIEPAVPAHVIALAALDRLRQADLSPLGEVRRHYFRLSAVVRTYVEGRYAFNATDLTTEEIVGGLDGLPLASDDQRLLKHFLHQADRVKFAAYAPDPREIKEIFRQALTFVESTQPDAQEAYTEA